MADLTNILNGPWSPPARVEPDAPDIQLKNAIAASGLVPPNDIHLDGALHRFSSDGKSSKKKNGWYVAFSDGIPAGRFGCWKDGIDVPWKADVSRDITDADRIAMSLRQNEAKAKRDAERKLWQEAAAETCEKIWSGCAAASADHPYLAKKGIQPHTSRVTGDGRLVVPAYDADGEITSLQYIDGDSNKLFASQAKMDGARTLIGPQDGDTVYVVEGFATGASVHEATGNPTWVAFTKSGLSNIATWLRERHGERQDIVIVADNDESGEGQKYAREAAKRTSCRVIIPPILGDANDYAQIGDLHALLCPPANDWLVAADDFCAQPRPIRWLIKKWLRQDGLLMVHGPSGGGKTFVVLDWCLHMAAGLPEWNGCKVKQGGVVYLAGEGHSGLSSRIAAWKVHHGAPKLNMWLSRDGCDLNTPEGYKRASDSIRALDELPSLIVVDTLHRFLHGDENSAQDAKTMIDACNSLMAEFGCSTLLVHHTGVSEEAQHRARGSSAWKGALETEISIVKSGDGGQRKVSQKKQKDGGEADPVFVELQSVEIPGWIDEDGDQVSSAVPIIVDAPVAAKKDGKLDSFKKLFESAWWDSGAEELNGYPYVSRSGLNKYLVVGMGMSEASAKQSMKPSEPNRLIGALLTSQIIAPNGHGWSVHCPIFSSAMLMAKNS